MRKIVCVCVCVNFLGTTTCYAFFQLKENQDQVINPWKNRGL